MNFTDPHLSDVKYIFGSVINGATPTSLVYTGNGSSFSILDRRSSYLALSQGPKQMIGPSLLLCPLIQGKNWRNCLDDAAVNGSGVRVGPLENIAWYNSIYIMVITYYYIQ